MWNTSEDYHILVAHLSLRFADKKMKGKKVYFNGTGFLCRFKGRDILMTCKHNVLDSKGKKQRVEEVRVYFGRNGKETPVPCIPLDGRMFKWHPNRDVAFADVSHLDDKLPGYYGFEMGCYKSGTKGAYIEISGYPGERYKNKMSVTFDAERNTQWKVIYNGSNKIHIIKGCLWSLNGYQKEY